VVHAHSHAIASVLVKATSQKLCDDGRPPANSQTVDAQPLFPSDGTEGVLLDCEAMSILFVNSFLSIPHHLLSIALVLAYRK